MPTISPWPTKLQVPEDKVAIIRDAEGNEQEILYAPEPYIMPPGSRLLRLRDAS